MKAMQSQRINITLPSDLIKDMRMSIPPRGRSKFIANALRERLMRKRNLEKELAKSLKANKKLYEEIQEDFKYVDAEEFARIP